MRQHLGELWADIASVQGDKQCIVSPVESYSWSEFDQKGGLLAGALRHVGASASMVVGILCHNDPRFMVTLLSIFKLGATFQNINFRLAGPELAALCEYASTDVLVFHVTSEEKFRAAIDCGLQLKFGVVIGGAPFEHEGTRVFSFEDLLGAGYVPTTFSYAEDEQILLCTGGTTGRSRAVVYRHGDIARFQFLSLGIRGVTPPVDLSDWPAWIANGRVEDIRGFPACPLMHTTGLTIGAMMPLTAGGMIVLSGQIRFDAGQTIELARQHQVTDLTIVGDAFATPLLDVICSNAMMTKLRFIFSSGVVFSRQNKRRFHELGELSIVDVLGSTEAGMGVAISRNPDEVEQDIFAPMPGVTVLDAAGNPLSPGSSEIGRIAVTNFTSLGYLADPAKTAEVYVATDEVRCVPGDFGYLLEDGRIQLVGRGSSCINTGGEKVYAEEVEGCLRNIPGIYDCAVIGQPDEVMGARVVAIVALQQGYLTDLGEIRDHLRPMLAGYKMPKDVVVVDVIQRLPNGKMDLDWAREMASTRLARDK